MPEGGFPRTLLDQPPEARMAYFRMLTIAHPLLKQADLALKQAIQDPAGWSLILVYGPTGVGKTTLRLAVEKHLKQSLLAALREDPGRVPVASVEAPADFPQFSWKEYYRRALFALEEPLADRKIDYRVGGVFRDESGRLTMHPRAAGLEVRFALESALVHRRPVAFFIDEAQHLAKMKSGRKLQDQLDSIKSLASLTNTVHVLIGTYELLPFRNLSAQLSRRSVDIHFRRYHPERQEEYGAFQSVVFTFQRHLPLPGETDLLKHFDYCCERSIGCVGVLKQWLTRALAQALASNSPVITCKMLEQTAWSVAQAERMAKETLEGEADLMENDESRERLRKLLGLSSVAALKSHSQILPECLPSKPRHRTGRVGQRRPARDIIGASHDASRAAR
jgi:DNA polymerase III delta prime subunit